jgi:ATP/maltotriose-dependent transcriptional regulator MalT
VDGAAGLADCSYGLSCLLREIGDLKLSRSHGFDAIEAYLEVGDQRGHAVALRSMAMVSRAADHLDEAAEYARKAVAVSTADGSDLLTAYCQQALAKIRIRQGRASTAIGLLTDGLATCQALHDRFGSALVMRTIGELHLATGDFGCAELMLTRSWTLWQTLGLPVFRARVERDLAVVHERSGDSERAHQVRQAALATFRHHGAREYRELTTSSSEYRKLAASTRQLARTASR